MSAPCWIDIGVNLTDNSFNSDRSEVIERSFAAGVGQMILTGTTLQESLQAIELCQQYPGRLFCTAGVHPHYAKDHSASDLAELQPLYREDCVIAVGETGLDFNRNFSPANMQIAAFEKQVEMAAECGLPLFLHERDAHQKQVEILKTYRDDFRHAVAHCFTGSKRELYNYLDLDLHIGITGWICDERRGSELQRLVSEIPADRLMLETDAPYLIPRDLKPKPRSRRNLPEFLPHIAAKVASLRGVSLKQLQTEVATTSRQFFRLADPTD
ncbi:TatD family hydrolase [Neptuniibacter halophilus]|uniref:TatD family hydrolase n=1 Tax=Neptuniibacter halophilus TaxID=651666 RepID=UPI0025743DBA|nr:TatD family hydrolase [Neptuniibacter halophilus]